MNLAEKFVSNASKTDGWLDKQWPAGSLASQVNTTDYTDPYVTQQVHEKDAVQFV